MTKFSRRTVLRGAGVALALPWLESLAPRAARGAAAPPPPRFIAFSFPEGTASFWKPVAGAGAQWALSPILEPLGALKKKVTVLGNVGNYGPFGGHIEPSTSNLTAAFLTCTKAIVTTGSPAGVTLGPSVDQVVAKALAGRTKLDSLQVGLSTLDSYTDGLPGACARSISWASATAPLFKLVSPRAVFDRIVGAGPIPGAPTGGLDVVSAARRAANKSILDFVDGRAGSLRAKVGRTDRARLDDFLASVRALEVRAADAVDCSVLPRPTENFGVGMTMEGYDRGKHADLMIDLVIMALRCDVTRVVSFMLDDSRSDFVYNFLPVRKFTAAGSTPGTGTERCGGYDGLTHAGNSNDGWATVNRWFVEKLAAFCQKLDAIPDGAGTMLDSSVVWFGSEMHDGGANDALNLPLLYAGSGGGVLRTDRYIDFATTPRQVERLANVYLTFLRNVFNLPVTTFGTGPATGLGAPPNAFGPGTDVIPELLV